jgi:hypothetical protein
MNKKVMKNIIKSLAMFVCVLVLANFFTGCSFGKKDSSFSISGYVFDESGAPVENVSISSELGETLTDKDGKYVISGISTSIIVRPSIDGYYFAEPSKKIVSKNDDANFVASQEYTITGYTHNNNVPVQNVSVELTSLAGTFVTQTDESGKFVASGVAGETKINCSIGGVQFYETTATIENSTISINSTSSFTINFAFDCNNVDYSKINFFVDGVQTPLFKSSTVLNEIKCGTVFELQSDEYKFDKTKFTAQKLDQVENVTASKIYSVSGVVRSGETMLKGAEVYLANKKATTTDQNGKFELSGLTSSNELSVSYSNLLFNVQEVDYTKTELDFNGTKNITIELVFDNFVGEDISFSHADAQKDTVKKYSLFDVALGEVVALTSNSYYLSSQTLVVENSDFYNLNCYAIYSTSINIDADFEYSILLDGQVTTIDDLQTLYGTHTMSAAYLNYVFNSCEVSYKNQTATLTYQIPYNVELTFKSGDISFANSQIALNENEFETDNDGKIYLENLVGEQTFEICCDGFNKTSIVLNYDNSLSYERDVNLTYNVDGTIKTGTIPVQMAVVSAGNISVSTNSSGKFVLENLSGNQELTISKEYFSFSSNFVNKNETLEIAGTYKIFGVISNGTETLSDRVVYLRETSNASIQQATTDENGYYEFNDVAGKFWLLTVDENGETNLKPDYYTVTCGGEYNFNLNGFKISGVVKSGELIVAGAYVIAGSSSTYTDENGAYTFELLTNPCTVSVSKNGYDFGDGIYVDETNSELNFNGSFKVYGYIKSGTKNVAGVKVFVNGSEQTISDDNGYFDIVGIFGENTLTFEKSGFVFDDTYVVSSYGSVSVNSKMTKTISVVSGDINIENFDYYINETYAGTSLESTFELNLTFGDKLTIQKQGYVFDEIVASEDAEISVSGTYSVSGVVASGDNELSNATIKYGETFVQTDHDGNFTISGLVGTTTAIVKLTGFNDENIEFNGFNSNLKIDLSYGISGTIYVGEKPLENVNISLDGTQVKTGSDGKFEFVGIIGKYTLIFEKEGYSFDSFENQFGSQNLTVSAYYKVSGIVKTGNIPISLVDVELVGEDGKSTFTQTDLNGYYEFANVSGKCNIIVSKDGYDSLEVSNIDDLNLNVNFNLSYSVTFNFSVTDVKIYLNGELKATSLSKTFSIDKLVGKNSFTFAKANTTFKPNDFEISEPTTLTISAEVAYDIDGYVSTNSGIAIPNVTLKIGSKTATTDGNGYFTLSGVAGTLSLVNSSLSSESKQITKDGSYNFSVANSDFAYYLYENAYKNLDNAASFQIYGSGTVTPSMGGSQTVFSVVKKDNNGNRLKQNLNYGSKILSVDPKVSLLAYYNKSSDTWFYEQIKDVNQDLTANHSSSTLLSQSISIADYQSKYGARPDAYLPYNFSKSSGIKSISTISINSSGNYTFTITLETSSSVYSMYAQQMKALSDQSVKSFDHINLNYEIDKNGWIVKLNIEENYTVELMSVNITSNIDYKFTTQKANMKIDAIDVSSDSAIQTSIKESSQTEILSESISNYSNIILVNDLIYGNKKGGAI